MFFSDPSPVYSQRVGKDYLRVVAGGWMHAVDYNKKCTSTLLDAFAAYLIELDVADVIPQVHLFCFGSTFHPSHAMA